MTQKPTAHSRANRLKRSVPFLVALGLIGGVLYWIFRTVLTVEPVAAFSSGNELLKKRNVLVVVGHPDDAEWYIGGTLKRLADLGAAVHVIVGTSGEKGPNHFDVPNLPEVREQEQRAAGEINGYSDIYFLRLPDRGVAADARFMPEVIQIYNRLKPDAVLAFDASLPSLPYLHVDHQGTARAFLTFWKTLPENRPPVYLFQTRRPDTAIDISTVIETKARALMQHRSQFGDQDSNGGRMRESFRGQGRRLGVEYAETFRVVR